ncbi:hypothetical protein EVAR_62284_1 [Eumeta japonica]|uniref:Uncharacterized protein n=1 Tax=Eumeta variegata TaxID=151549 RepID=A0A4C1ZWR0_EUMVA|nr:hypothetical protein EVAR_62284_1 [Eumeta japonica]
MTFDEVRNEFNTETVVRVLMRRLLWRHLYHRRGESNPRVDFTPRHANVQRSRCYASNGPTSSNLSSRPFIYAGYKAPAQLSPCPIVLTARLPAPTSSNTILCGGRPYARRVMVGDFAAGVLLLCGRRRCG